MANTAHVRGTGPDTAGLGKRSARVDKRPLGTGASPETGLRDAALDVERLIARVDPRQLTAADRQCLRELLQQLNTLARLTC